MTSVDSTVFFLRVSRVRLVQLRTDLPNRRMARRQGVKKLCIQFNIEVYEYIYDMYMYINKVYYIYSMCN